MSVNHKMTRKNNAFTILEVLIALTASLLLMLALTRAFKLIGDRITQSQSELGLASTLRDATFRLRDELRNITPVMEAPLGEGKGDGYFTYYEGPWTDTTTTMIHGRLAQGVAPYYPTSRIGDLDDYLAFTTRTNQETPFSGYVPAGIVEAFRLAQFLAENPGANLSAFTTLQGKTIGTFTQEDARQSVMIYSDVAEVCYFLAPQWARNDMGIPLVAQPTGGAPTPAFLDVINESGTVTAGDGVPDRLTLRRRVLLVRPDLNLSPPQFLRLAQRLSGSASTPTEDCIPFLDGGTLRQLHEVETFDPGTWLGAPVASSPNWLTGMGRPLQWMDLSIRRSINPSNGVPTNRLRANSLIDLRSPENRFASVRIPASLLQSSPPSATPVSFPASMTSSMPVLALSPPHELIRLNESNESIFGTDTVNYAAMGGQTATSASTSPFALVGFVRPEFSLADHWYEFSGTGTRMRPTLRGGSDIVAEDVIAFDVQAYDPDAPIGTVPPIGSPPSEAWSGSNKVTVEANNVAMRTIMGNFFGSPPPAPSFVLRPYGGFVDYGYSRLAGSPIGGNVLGRIPNYGTTRARLSTAFSGMTTADDFPEGWYSSGRFVLSAGTIPSFYQATVDTWSRDYERDAFIQDEGMWTSTADLVFTGNLGVKPTGCRYWTSRRTTEPDNLFVQATSAATGKAESDPPTRIMPRGIKITIRVYDRNAGEIRQQSIIEHFRN